MTNQQAAKLRPGTTIRRKVLYADRAAATGRETLIVERVEPPTHYYDTMTVHAGGQAFRPWEIERVRYPDERTP